MDLLNFNKVSGKSRGEFLKLIALVTMAIDHIGFNYSSDSVMRVIGRISLPIFCYLLVQGYLHTSSFKKYASRLFVFSIISQIPFTYYFGKNELNIFMTLFIALLALYAFEKRFWVLFFSLLVTSVAVPMDYGIYVVFLVMIFYAFEKGFVGQNAFLISFFLGTLGATLLSFWPVQMFAILSPFLIYLTPNINYRIKIPKYAYYAFYPAHLILLSFIFK
jgi:hypothetical protein